MTTDNWISVKEKLPNEIGWYRVKVNREGDECEVPLSRNLQGELIWVVPDTSVITHWQPLPKPPKEKIQSLKKTNK